MLEDPTLPLLDVEDVIAALCDYYDAQLARGDGSGTSISMSPLIR